LIQPAEQAVALPAVRPWLLPAALVCAGVACIAAALLGYALGAAALGRAPLLWVDTPAQGPGGLALAVGLALLAGAVLAVVLGLLAIAERAARRPLAVLAVALGAASLLAVAAAFAGAAWAAAAGPLLPTDERLSAAFEARRPQLEAVATARLAGEPGDPELLWAADLAAGSVSRSAGVLYLEAARAGLYDGSAKGYAYSRQPLPVMDAGELDARSVGEGDVVYRQLSGPWYLYYRRF
jgi:hypothetical protein